jgi:hypothetical protein
MLTTHRSTLAIPDSDPMTAPGGLVMVPTAEVGEYDDFGNDDDFEDFDEDFDDDFEEELEDDYAFEDDDEFLNDDFTKEGGLEDETFDGEMDDFSESDESSKSSGDDEEPATEDKD